MSEAAAARLAVADVPDRRRLMVGIAFLAQNVATGMGFGAYGTVVAAVQHSFATSRTLASTGLSVMAVMFGLCAPVAGAAIQRFGVRPVMIGGALVCGTGYALLAFTRDIHVLLAIFALLVGPGACLLGPVSASTLVANWVAEADRGRALGFVNMSFFVFVFPFIASAVLVAGGLRAVFLMLAVITFAMVPLLLLIVDRPPVLLRAPDAAAAVVQPVALSTGTILRRPAFLVLAVGTSLTVALGMTMVTHIVPIGLDAGLSLRAASLLLSMFGIAGAAGALLLGWLADRAGPRIALLAMALVPLPGLYVLGHATTSGPLLASSALIGLAAGSVTGLQGAALSSWLGRPSFARALGLLYLFQVPFLFGAAPLAGYVFDRTGSYHAALALNMATMGAVGLMFLLYRPRAVPAPA